MNRNYYEKLNAYLAGKESGKLLSVTYLEGSCAGEKELLSGRAQEENTGEGVAREAKAGVKEIGGQRAFVEPIVKAPVCVICGAGHVGVPMARLASFSGFEVIVVEDRPGFADEARRAGADQVICDSFEQGLLKVPGGQQVYFVVMTRGHRYDEVCLSRILQKDCAYVGMMASRGRAARMKKLLLERGFDSAKVEAVHTPIGLDIHAKTPEEIAVSVLAQMIEVKNGSDAGVFYDREILEHILQKEDRTPWVLATIIRRSGSAPRDVGAKMLMTDSGAVIGSIGGGCMEAEVLRAASLFVREENVPVKIITADMSGAQAEDAGMVCGGRIEVLLEVVR